jgi:transcriptional regulator with XRE-family HTH domain
VAEPLRQLARIRRAVGLTQGDLAKRAGLNQQDVSMFERGLLPDPNHVLRLAAVLGVEPEALSAGRITIECTSITNTIAVRTGAV